MLRVGVPASNKLRTRSISLVPKHQQPAAKREKLPLDVGLDGQVDEGDEAQQQGSGGGQADSLLARSAPQYQDVSAR